MWLGPPPKRPSHESQACSQRLQARLKPNLTATKWACKQVVFYAVTINSPNAVVILGKL